MNVAESYSFSNCRNEKVSIGIGGREEWLAK
jgi:hypothetical protein